MRKWLLRIGVGLLIGFVGVQFVPVEGVNPAVESDVPMSSEMKAAIRRACYDCHSNVWPWYSQVAPVSWLIARDVRFGRSKLNFSAWDKYKDRKKTGKLREIVSELKAGTMPPSYYALMHIDAALSTHEQELIIRVGKGWGCCFRGPVTPLEIHLVLTSDEPISLSLMLTLSRQLIGAPGSLLGILGSTRCT
jgi:hypothetical protein